VYALDANGNRVPQEIVPKKEAGRRARRAPGLEFPDKEIIVDLPWVAVMGIVDHRAIERVLASGARIERFAAESVYQRVDLQRQERFASGLWSEWQRVDPEPTTRVLDNLPELDRDNLPGDFRISSLVDPLPYLKAGDWKGVEVDRIILPTLRRNIPSLPPTVPPLLMVRKLDPSVQPGRTYRYRARLVLADVRQGSAQKKEIASAWSDMTEPVVIP
jgi:hypothetical protein